MSVNQMADTLSTLHDLILAELDDRVPTALYRDRILTQRTRQFVLFPENTRRVAPEQVSIDHTLLGIELKIGHRRLSCPDLATARYLRVFGRLGVGIVAVPYDITQISRLADDLESGWQHLVLLVEARAADRPLRTRLLLRNRLIAGLRDEIEALGAGTKIPAFNQSTKQHLARPRSGHR